MTPLTLYNKNKTEYIHVPYDFVDHYLSEAPGEFVKIYLYLLRVEADSTNPTLSEMADKLDFTEKDVMRALNYWEKQNLIALVYDSEKKLCGINFQSFSNIAKPESAEASLVPPKKHYTKSQLAKLAENPEARQVIFIAEQYLGTSFNSTEQETLMYIYDGLGFSCDLIEYLLGICVEQHLTALSHVEEMAVRWAEKGVKTIEEAKKITSVRRKDCQSVCDAFGIQGRALAESEQAFVFRWIYSYGFSIPFILEACSRTIQATGKPSFPYADSILKNWKRAGVSSMEDVQALDAAHQTLQAQKPLKKVRPNTKGNNFPQRSYDYPSLEQQLLNVN